jgi:hypothetical protein
MAPRLADDLHTNTDLLERLSPAYAGSISSILLPKGSLT